MRQAKPKLQTTMVPRHDDYHAHHVTPMSLYEVVTLVFGDLYTASGDARPFQEWLFYKDRHTLRPDLDNWILRSILESRITANFNPYVCTYSEFVRANIEGNPNTSPVWMALHRFTKKAYLDFQNCKSVDRDVDRGHASPRSSLTNEDIAYALNDVVPALHELHDMFGELDDDAI